MHNIDYRSPEHLGIETLKGKRQCSPSLLLSLFQIEALPKRSAFWSAESEALPQRKALWSAESEANNDGKIEISQLLTQLTQLRKESLKKST